MGLASIYLSDASIARGFSAENSSPKFKRHPGTRVSIHSIVWRRMADFKWMPPKMNLWRSSEGCSPQNTGPSRPPRTHISVLT